MQIFITGMHRSGTSVVARLIRECGAYLGRDEDLMPSKPDNPLGFWENLRAYDIDMAILEAAGVAWDTVIGGELDLLSHADRAEAAARIHDFVSDMSPQGVWAVKDPRLSLTFPLWRPMLTDPVVIWCVRHPIEIGVSLEGRNGFPIHLGVSIWESYAIQAMRNFAGVPVVVASYNDLLDDPCDEVRRLVTSVNEVGQGEINIPDDKAVTSIVEGKLRRSSVSSIPEGQIFTAHSQRLWERSQIAEGWDSTDPPPELSRLSRDAILVHRQLLGLEKNLDPGPEAGLHEALAGFESRSAERTAVLDARIVEVIDRWESILAAEGELTDTKTQLAETLGYLSAHRAELDDVNSKYGELQVRFGEVSEAKGRELAQGRTEFAELQARFSEASEVNGRELAQARTDFAELHARFSELSETSDRELSRAHAELARQQSVLADIRSSKGGRLLHWWWGLRDRG